MTEECERYFQEKFGGVDGFIQAGRRRGLDPESIRRACEIVYDGLKPGDALVAIGQKVHIQARLLEKELIHSEEKRLTELEHRMNDIENSTFSRRWRKFLDRLIEWSTYG